MLDLVEKEATRKGDALIMGGVCLGGGGGGCHKSNFSFQTCAGGCSHAWAVHTSKAVEVYNRAAQFLRDAGSPRGKDTYFTPVAFDCFIQGYALERQGLLTLEAKQCNHRNHCGMWMQNRTRHRTSIHNETTIQNLRHPNHEEVYTC